MTSLKKANNNKNQNTSERAPPSTSHTDIFQFIQKSVLDHNTCTVNLILLTVNVDSH